MDIPITTIIDHLSLLFLPNRLELFKTTCDSCVSIYILHYLYHETAINKINIYTKSTGQTKDIIPQLGVLEFVLLGLLKIFEYDIQAMIDKHHIFGYFVNNRVKGSYIINTSPDNLLSCIRLITTPQLINNTLFKIKNFKINGNTLEYAVDFGIYCISYDRVKKRFTSVIRIKFNLDTRTYHVHPDAYLSDKPEFPELDYHYVGIDEFVTYLYSNYNYKPKCDHICTCTGNICNCIITWCEIIRKFENETGHAFCRGHAAPVEFDQCWDYLMWNSEPTSCNHSTMNISACRLYKRQNSRNTG